MSWSGLLIYWANPVSDLGIGDWVLFHFFPDSFYKYFDLDHRLAEGMSVHFTVMWIFALNGLFYFLYLLLARDIRFLVPKKHAFRDAFAVVIQDLGLRGVVRGRDKYNPAQRLAYTSVVLMGAGSLVTGLAIYKPAQLATLTFVLGGYEWARWEHFWLMIGFAVFFCIHILQVLRAGWNNFRSMVAGFEVDSE